MEEQKLKIKIEKTEQAITYQKITETHTFLVNGKSVRVYDWSFDSEYEGCDGGTDIDERDAEALTTEEMEALDDEMNDLLTEEVGFIKELEY